MAIKYLSGNRVQGTSTERTSSTLLGNPPQWVELTRYEVTSATKTWNTAEFDKYPYLMLLWDCKVDQTNADPAFRFNNDSGNNYRALTQWGNGSSDTDSNTQNYLKIAGGNDNEQIFCYMNFANPTGTKVASRIGHGIATQEKHGSNNYPYTAQHAMRWNGTEQINQIYADNVQSSGSRQWKVGSELVVLGFDPNGGATKSSFWQQLGTFTGSTPSGTIASKKYIFFDAWLKSVSSGDSGKFQVGVDSLDSGSNYNVTYDSNGAGNTGETSAKTGSEPLTVTTPIYYRGYILNKAGDTKICIMNGTRINSAGVSNYPSRWEESWTYTANKSSQINHFGAVPHGSGAALDSSSYVRVWGAD